MDNRCMKTRSTSFIIRETQRKPTVRYTWQLSECLLSEQLERTSNGKSVKRRQLVCTVGESAHWYNHYGKQCRVSSKTEKWNYPIIQQSIYPRKVTILIWKDVCAPGFISMLLYVLLSWLFTIINTWTQLECPPMDEWIRCGTDMQGNHAH